MAKNNRSILMQKLRRMVGLSIGLGLCGVALLGCDDSGEVQGDIEGAYLFGNLSDDVWASLPIVGVKEIGGLGSYPSDLSIAGEHAYIVDYSNNAIHRVDLERYVVDKNFIDLGQNAGPYSVYANGDNIWVTTQKIKQVLRFDREGKQKSLVLSEEHIVAPTDVVFYDGYTIVADSEYDYTDSSKTGGSILSISSDGGLVERKTSAQNPVFVRVVEYGDDAYIVVVDAGVISYGADFSVEKLPERSCLDVWKLSDFVKKDEEYSPKSVCVENASLGGMAWSKEMFYVGDAMQPQYHAIAMSELFDMASKDQNLKTIALSGGDYTTLIKPIVVEEALFLFDSAKNAVRWKKGNASHVFALAPEGDVKMPIDAEYNSTNKKMVVLNSASASVDVFDVK